MSQQHRASADNAYRVALLIAEALRKAFTIYDSSKLQRVLCNDHMF